MIKVAFFLAIFSVFIGAIRIGRNTDISDHPWQVAIFHINTLRCGGALISPNWVLTSCRCLCYPYDRTPLPVKEMYLVLGATNISQGITYGVSTTITNDEWDSGQLNDVGLIGSSAPILEEFATPVALPDVAYTLYKDTIVAVTGWGRTGPREGYPDTLQEIDVKVEDNSICLQGFYQNESVINEDMFCGGVDYCEGDLGGPVTLDGLLVGIISQGADCYFTEKPGMYQLVASFRIWIYYFTDV